MSDWNWTAIGHGTVIAWLIFAVVLSIIHNPEGIWRRAFKRPEK